MMLSELLKKANGPSREIDGLIFQLVGGAAWDAALARAREPSGCPQHIAESTACGYSPAFTRSIDDALKLLPGNWSWRVGNLPSGKGFADLGTQRSLQCVEGATPAIALATACVIAIEQQRQSERAVSG